MINDPDNLNNDNDVNLSFFSDAKQRFLELAPNWNPQYNSLLEWISNINPQFFANTDDLILFTNFFRGLISYIEEDNLCYLINDLDECLREHCKEKIITDLFLDWISNRPYADNSVNSFPSAFYDRKDTFDLFSCDTCFENFTIEELKEKIAIFEDNQKSLTNTNLIKDTKNVKKFTNSVIYIFYNGFQHYYSDNEVKKCLDSFFKNDHLKINDPAPFIAGDISIFECLDITYFID